MDTDTQGLATSSLLQKSEVLTASWGLIPGAQEGNQVRVEVLAGRKGVIERGIWCWGY